MGGRRGHAVPGGFMTRMLKGRTQGQGHPPADRVLANVVSRMVGFGAVRALIVLDSRDGGNTRCLDRPQPPQASVGGDRLGQSASDGMITGTIRRARNFGR
jgi:hypothetical protein